MESAKMALEVKTFDWSQFDELKAFLAKWSPDHPELAQGDIIKWQECDRFVAMDGNEIVGYIAQIKHPFKYKDGREELLGWGVTLVIKMDDDKVRKEAGRALLTKCENNGSKYAGVGMVPVVEKVYERRGHVIRRDCCNMYARFFNPQKCLDYVDSENDSIYAWAIKVGNWFNGVKRYPVYGRGLKYDRTNYYLNDMLVSKYEFYGQRTEKFLEYKLSQPNREYKINWVDGGYVVYRIAKHPLKDLTLMKVCDIVCRDNVIVQMLSDVVWQAKLLGVDGVVAIDSKREAGAYKKAGMWIKRAYPICMPKDIKEKIRVTFFDSDLDNLW